ncbi:hypothetical protein X975_13064, partial [Stegodyphus mimosarum]
MVKISFSKFLQVQFVTVHLSCFSSFSLFSLLLPEF